MPLEKYTTKPAQEKSSSSTSSSNNSKNSNAALDRRLIDSKSLSPKSNSPSPTFNEKPSSSPPPHSSSLLKTALNQNQANNFSIANQMSSISELLPNVIEAAASSAAGSATDTLILNNSNIISIPPELKMRLNNIFKQIEFEFDKIYTENLRLHQQITNSMIIPISNNCNESLPKSPTQTAKQINVNNSENASPIKANLAQANSLPISIKNDSNLTSTITSTAVSPYTSASLTGKSKNRMNNLSFPKFKPNAKEFIMQSIKNTSAQIVNKAQSHANATFVPKHLSTLSQHRDGIWDINCISIPSHLLNNRNYANYNEKSFNVNYNLLIGTASADTTARLWYLNSISQQQVGYTQNQLSPIHHPGLLSTNPQQMISTAFCIQEYCGHGGSVNSIRFHPKFFTEATNLILTGSGDCQAHIWQCVLSPISDSLESTSEVVLNYSNCYSYALSNYTNPPTLSPSSPSSHNSNAFTYQQPSSPIRNSTNHYYELISNTSIIRSPIKRYEGHSEPVIAAEWFPDGEFLVTASWDRTANVYNVETGKVMCNLQHDDFLTNVNIHKQFNIILTSSKDTTFKVWDFRDPIRSVNVYQGHHRSVNSAIFIDDDKIATSSDDQSVKLWDLRIMRSPVCTINVNSGVNRICSMKASLDQSANSETFLCLPLDNRNIKVYNLSGDRVLRLPHSNLVGHRRLVTSLASHGSLLLSASFDKTVNCWSLDYVPPKSTNIHNSKMLTAANSIAINDESVYSGLSQANKKNQNEIANKTSYLALANEFEIGKMVNNSNNKVASLLNKNANKLKL